jgi:hypothetical protein
MASMFKEMKALFGSIQIGSGSSTIGNPVGSRRMWVHVHLHVSTFTTILRVHSMTYYLRQHVQGSTTSLQAHGRISTNDGSGSLTNMAVWFLKVVFNLCSYTKIKLRTKKKQKPHK